jgi:uncharacterized membrane protein YfcA
VTPADAVLLVCGGLAAGIVNTLAGGGSLLTVPLLVLIGLPGTLANGTNRIGVLLQNAVAAWRFRREGVWDVASAKWEIAAVAVGAVTGAAVISQVSDSLFERMFGIAMLALLVPTLRKPRPRNEAGPQDEAGLRDEPAAERPAALRLALFFGIGLYGGAFQAGVGILLVLALSYAGYDLVRANALKVTINFCFTLVAVPVFIAARQVVWAPALVLAAGFAAGGEIGARLAVRGGERLIRPVLGVAIVTLAGRLLGLY